MTWPDLNLRGSGSEIQPHGSFATGLMQQGEDKWKTAGLPGMSMNVLERTCDKHRLDFMAEAASPIIRK